VQLDPNAGILGQKPTIYKCLNLAILDPTSHHICQGPISDNNGELPTPAEGFEVGSLTGRVEMCCQGGSVGNRGYGSLGNVYTQHDKGTCSNTRPLQIDLVHLLTHHSVHLLTHHSVHRFRHRYLPVSIKGPLRGLVIYLLLRISQ